MDSSHTDVIYEATAKDAVKLWYLSQLTGEPRLRDRALIGDIQGTPAAAISLTDGRIVADPRRATAGLMRRLRSRARSMLVAELVQPREKRAAAAARADLQDSRSFA